MQIVLGKTEIFSIGVYNSIQHHGTKQLPLPNHFRTKKIDTW